MNSFMHTQRSMHSAPQLTPSVKLTQMTIAYTQLNTINTPMSAISSPKRELTILISSLPIQNRIAIQRMMKEENMGWMMDRKEKRMRNKSSPMLVIKLRSPQVTWYLSKPTLWFCQSLWKDLRWRQRQKGIFLTTMKTTRVQQSIRLRISKTRRLPLKKVLGSYITNDSYRKDVQAQRSKLHSRQRRQMTMLMPQNKDTNLLPLSNIAIKYLVSYTLEVSLRSNYISPSISSQNFSAKLNKLLLFQCWFKRLLSRSSYYQKSQRILLHRGSLGYITLINRPLPDRSTSTWLTYFLKKLNALKYFQQKSRISRKNGSSFSSFSKSLMLGGRNFQTLAGQSYSWPSLTSSWVQPSRAWMRASPYGGRVIDILY